MRFSRVPRNVSVWLIDSSLVATLGLPPKDPHDDDDDEEKTKRTRRKTKSQRSSENQMNVDVSVWRYQVALVASGLADQRPCRTRLSEQPPDDVRV
jgi:hypothetical protein